MNAGPFHEIREQHGGYDLGLYCRQSIRAGPRARRRRDLVTFTAQGLAFFGDRSGSPFPQVRYDQVFVPNLGGAMENWGCVTYGDGILPRSPRPATSAAVRRGLRAARDGAHVVRRPGDHALVGRPLAQRGVRVLLAQLGHGERHGVHRRRGRRSSIFEKLVAYDEDMTPATHPIRSEVPDVALAMANFDGITYYKGQAVLRQLVEYVGEPAFTRGLQALLRPARLGQHPPRRPGLRGGRGLRARPRRLDRRLAGPAPARTR